MGLTRQDWDENANEPLLKIQDSVKDILEY